MSPSRQMARPVGSARIAYATDRSATGEPRARSGLRTARCRGSGQIAVGEAATGRRGGEGSVGRCGTGHRAELDRPVHLLGSDRSHSGGRRGTTDRKGTPRSRVRK